MRHAWIAIWVAACGGGSDVGSPCSESEPCGDGVCDFTDPAGPICIARDGDLDGDGIPNSKDHCNHAPGGEFDEDGDGIGDDCDRCPIARPPETPDADGDDVDSPCDPDPATPGDRIVVFEGFAAGQLPAGWTATPGFQFVAGEAVAMPADPLAVEQLSAPLPLASQQTSVLGQYRIDGVIAQATESFAGVLAADERPAGGAIIQCAGTRNGSTDRLLLDTDTAADSTGFTNLFDSASLYRVAMVLDRATAACAMVADDEMGATQAATGGELMNRGGLVAKGATARFAYLLVVQRAN